MVCFVYTRGLDNNIVFRKLVVQLRAAEYFLFDSVSETDLEEFQSSLTYLGWEHVWGKDSLKSEVGTVIVFT